MEKKSLIPENYKPIAPQIPDLSKLDEEHRITHEEAIAQIELLSVNKFLSGELFTDDEPVRAALYRYRHYAEIYAIEYKNHHADLARLLEAEGALVEMFSEILVFEREKGETPRSQKSKARLKLLQSALNVNKRYITDYEQMLQMLEMSASDRTVLMKQNSVLKKKIQDIIDAENY